MVKGKQPFTDFFAVFDTLNPAVSSALKSLPISSQCVIEPRGDIQATILVRTQVSKIRGKSRNGAADVYHRRLLTQCPTEYFADFYVKNELILMSYTEHFMFKVMGEPIVDQRTPNQLFFSVNSIRFFS